MLGSYKETPAAKAVRRGVIYSLGLSPLDGNRLWAGTDDGLIWTTADGGANWKNVTPPELQALLEGLQHGRRALRWADGVCGGEHDAVG